jgi:sugar lactone lactonase YvrE
VDVPFAGTGHVTMVVDCTGANGTLLVRTATSGASLDADGYFVGVGDDLRQIGVQDSALYQLLPAGDHVVTLSGIAANCTVAEPNPRTVNVSAGTTLSTQFDIVCTAPMGSLTVNTATTGASLDPDGYTVTLTGTASQPIATTGSVTFPALVAGEYQVGLTGIASNCQLASGTNPRTVAVAAGPATPTTFELACVAPIPSKLVFISSEDGDDEIFTMNGDGTNRLQITHNGSNEGDPDWSPDGARIAYEGGEAASEIWVVQADGNNPVRLTNLGVESDDPDWSPDGTRIVFETDDGSREIAIMNADGSNLRILTNTPAHSEKPQFSPDGTRILFFSNRDGNYEIYVMNVDGSNLQRLTTHPQDDYDAAWSPDGAHIVFGSERDGNGEIYIMDPDGGNVQRVTNNLVDDWAPTWSPDGLFIVFTSDRDGDEDLFSIRPSGANELRLTANSVSDKDADWRPQP